MSAKDRPLLFGCARNDVPAAAAEKVRKYGFLNSSCKLLVHLRAAVLTLPVVAMVTNGCMVSKSRYTELETQNRALSEQNRAQLAEIENLTIHARSMEERLQQAEEEWTLFEGQNGFERRRLAEFSNQYQPTR